jgi:S-DNA-T family DNA segregation ATPase FtsK/SpoIIIE
VETKKHEILGLFLFVASVLILLSLVSFHATDLTLFNASSVSRPPRNWIGSFGANLAWCLIFFLGLGGYWLPATGLWASWSLIRGRGLLPGGALRLSGLALLILSTVSMAAVYAPKVHLLSQEIATGGQLGEVLAGFLRSRLYPLGSAILLVGVFFCGLLLATPFSFNATSAWLKRCAGKCQQNIAALFSGRRQQGQVVGALATADGRAIKDSETALPSNGAGVVELLPAPVLNGEIADAAAPASPALKVLQTAGDYRLPPLDLLDTYETENGGLDSKILDANARVLEEKLGDFGVEGSVVGIYPGPVITMYEYAPAPGIKISRIVGLSDDLAMALKALSIRVVAPIPGKAAIGIEIPNPQRQMVSLRAVLESETFASSTAALTIALGKDIVGQPVVANLSRMPHLLVAGATGTGKSVCINALLSSLLYRNSPEELRLLLIDPKRIELSSYEGLPHLLHPVVTDAKMATRALRWAVQEMELRYRLLADKGARNIEGYNRALAKQTRDRKQPEQTSWSGANENGSLVHHHLPYVVLFIDELADLMMVASRDVEESIIRLAQMARAAGIHLVLATQRPSVDVLTGIIKANIPTRISFQVSSRTDSRTILDANGAESLLGAGDMLFLPPGTAKLQRIHGAFISETEVYRLTQFWRDQQLSEDPLRERVNLADQAKDDAISEDELDDKYQEAVAIVLETRQASISMLQRRLRVGYNRAARMIEIMEQQGLVGPSDGVKPREVFGSGRAS